MRQSRRGFTLIEILVVIGIIMILVSLLIYGFRAMNRTAAGNETKAELKVCTGMLTEYEGRNGLNAIEFFFPPGSSQQKDPGAPPGGLGQTFGFPVYGDPGAAIDNTNKTLTASFSPAAIGSCWPVVYLDDIAVMTGTTVTNGDMGDKSSGAGSSPRYRKAVQRSLDVIYVLMRIPANQTHLQAIEPKRQLEQVPGTPSPNTLQQGNVLLDGWNNPIIFVPRGGLHVNIKDASGTPQPYVVRSTGTLPIVGGGQDPPMTGNERPFFASAGQDGDFTQGEDNVYSFQD